MIVYKFLILLTIIIIILFYFNHKKKITQYFSVPLNKPQLNIHGTDKLLWMNQDMKKIKQDTKDFQTIFIPSNHLFYTNRSIDNNLDQYLGFYFEITEPLNNIQIGFHHAKMEDFKKPIYNIDFGFNFLNNQKLQIIEKFNPYIETEMATGQYVIQNISYCFLKNKKCLNTQNTVNINDDYNFAILIDQNMINYIIVKKHSSSDVPNSGLLLHQSKNKFTYPLYPVILNSKQENKIKKFRWCTSTLELAPTDYSVELLTKQKYNQIGLPPKVSLNRDTDISVPAPSIPKEKISFDREIEILHAHINNNNRVIHIIAQVKNITQKFLSNIYGVNILLSIPLKNKKHKKLLIPYIPLMTDNNMTLDNEDKLKMAVYAGDHLPYFYNRDIRIQVVLRLGEFTSIENIVSNDYIIDF